jgi:uncharacterized membrane protein
MVRLAPLDALRGLIMILMALDHANAFVARMHSPGEFWGSGPFPSYASGCEFLVRLVTHLCAPGFFLLMGAGMALFAADRRGRGVRPVAIARHFALRGALLVAINELVENPAWLLGSTLVAARAHGVGLSTDEALGAAMQAPGGGGLPVLAFGVLSALGLGMAVGGLLVQLPSVVVGMGAAAAVLVTHAFLPAARASTVLFPAWERLLLVAGQSGAVLVVYPVVPWLAPICLGILLGRALRRDPGRAYRGALAAGVALLLLFAVVRALGGPGNLRPAADAGWVSFLNVTKYPPSLAFLALTLGVDLVLLFAIAHTPALLGARGGGPAAAGGAPSGPAARRAKAPLLVFGRTPLFFYVVHLYLYAAIGLLVGPQGTGIALMVPVWLAGLIVLYPICRRFDAFKQSTPSESLWRLL